MGFLLTSVFHSLYFIDCTHLGLFNIFLCSLYLLYTGNQSQRLNLIKGNIFLQRSFRSAVVTSRDFAQPLCSLSPGQGTFSYFKRQIISGCLLFYVNDHYDQYLDYSTIDFKNTNILWPTYASIIRNKAITTMPRMALRCYRVSPNLECQGREKHFKPQHFSSTKSMCEAYAMFNYKGRRIKTSY